MADTNLELYTIWLVDGAVTQARDEIAALIQQAGLLEQGGTTTNRIAPEEIDLAITGKFRFGERLSYKQKTELESLGVSSYSGVPLFGQKAVDEREGYYEIAGVDVEPIDNTTTAEYSYTVALTDAGTHDSHWRGIRTNTEDIGTNLATGSDGLIAVDSQADKVRWFHPTHGTESATIQDTRDTEKGAVKHFDPTEPSFSGSVNPILLYELPYGQEWRTDVIVYDDRGLSRELNLYEEPGSGVQYDTVNYDTANYSKSLDAIQWPHIFHADYEFEGSAVIDTDRLRVRFDESAGELEAWQWNSSFYDPVTLDQSDYTLFDADLRSVGPSEATVFAEFEHTNGNIDACQLSFQQGFDELIVRTTNNETSVATDLEDMLTPIAVDWDTDPQPEQTLIRRTEVQ